MTSKSFTNPSLVPPEEWYLKGRRTQTSWRLDSLLLRFTPAPSSFQCGLQTNTYRTVLGKASARTASHTEANFHQTENPEAHA